MSYERQEKEKILFILPIMLYLVIRPSLDVKVPVCKNFNGF